MNYREDDAADRIRALAPGGVDVVVELAPATNARLGGAVLAAEGVVAVYASEPGKLELAVGDLMRRNVRYQFVLVYTVPQRREGRGRRGRAGGTRRRGPAGR